MSSSNGHSQLVTERILRVFKTLARLRFHARLLVLLVIGASFPAHATGGVILVLGDSISSAYGLDVDSGWVQLLQKRLDAQSADYRVVNASISGDTTSGGAARLSAALDRHNPDIVVVELGGNDGLRGLPLRETRDNLERIIVDSQATGARVLLLGMRLPPNYGPAYTDAFHAIYQTLAERYNVARVPFLLDGIGGVDALMQADGIHPRAEAQPMMLDNMWPLLQPLL